MSIYNQIGRYYEDLSNLVITPVFQ